MRYWSRGAPVVLLLISLLTLGWPRGGRTVPLYAARTGLLCGACHFDPNGGGPRNEFGFSFARNRHSLQPEDTTSQWHDLDVVNRVGESMPLYVGLNHRLLLLANSTTESDSLDRVAFFNMENAFHVAFQPHPKLTLVYTRDGSTTREAFGMIGGLPWGGYVRGGQFRNPFGLRLDDHTVATRNGYLDFYIPSVPFAYASLVRARFLPYDPRQVDTGLEVGAEGNGWFGRFSFTNGSSSLFAGPPFGNPFAETKAVKVGYGRTGYQGALSFYDDFQKNPGVFSDFKRATRWGYYGMTSYGPLALLGEVAAGTDESVIGPKRNLVAGFVEVDYAPRRAWNFRFRYDYVNLDRDRTEIDPLLAPGLTLSELNTHERYAVEGEYVPVPFAELRWTVRQINHKASRDPLGQEIDDETQAYLQLHFSY